MQASPDAQRALAAVLLEHAVPKLEALVAVGYPYRAQGRPLDQKPGFGCTNISSIKVGHNHYQRKNKDTVTPSSRFKDQNLIPVFDETDSFIWLQINALFKAPASQLQSSIAVATNLIT